MENTLGMVPSLIESIFGLYLEEINLRKMEEYRGAILISKQKIWGLLFLKRGFFKNNIYCKKWGICATTIKVPVACSEEHSNFSSILTLGFQLKLFGMLSPCHQQHGNRHRSS
jgi:hypothetical protein